jgi:hypothetical protein
MALTIITSGGSTVAEFSPHHRIVGNSSSATSTGIRNDKMALTMMASSGTVVYHSARHTKVEG